MAAVTPELTVKTDPETMFDVEVPPTKVDDAPWPVIVRSLFTVTASWKGLVADDDPTLMVSPLFA